ncbi:FAD dependent oxidoreductase superfamily [Xylogone sp. PMI_703]|nr:FAD dependent oxidoreductase superfamily [Xylogone sp. PMI_703]
MPNPDGETIVIVGAGVIGLSAAIRIQQHLTPSQSIVIVARDFPNTTSINYATPWAGAHYRPTPGKTPQLVQEAAWAKRTYEVFHRITAEEGAGSGVQFMPGEEYLENPPPEYLNAVVDISKDAYGHLSEQFERLSANEVGDPAIRLAIRYWTYCVNSPVYASYLLRKFVLKGGRTREYTLASLEEAFALEPNVNVVVNCSGMGFGDPSSFIIRGQTCLVRNPCAKTITRQNVDGSWSFAIPRPLEGGTIIGGTKQPHDWNPNPLPETRKTLLSNAAKWFPFPPNGPRTFDVVRDIVGRRPAREGGFRLEAEVIDVVASDGSKRIGNVIHAYGIGGRGVELSWGIADDAVGVLLKKGIVTEKASK